MIINTATTALHEQIWWGMEKKKALVDLPDVTISIKGSWKTIESAKSVNKYKNCFELRRKVIAVMKSGYSCGNERSPVLDKISSHELFYNDAELPVTRSQALIRWMAPCLVPHWKVLVTKSLILHCAPFNKRACVKANLLTVRSTSSKHASAW